MNNEKIVDFLVNNKIYRDYDPKDYMSRVELRRELGYMDNSLKKCLSVKPSKKMLGRYKNKTYELNLRFGVIVYIENTEEDYLRQMIESVLSQTYENFLFYILDNSDRAHAYIANICTDYEDGRIIYRKIRRDMALSWDYFSCDYVVMMNQVDALHPLMLSYAAEEIEKSQDEIVYFDSGIFRKNKYNIFNCILKPDYARVNLEVYNYIGDNIVFSKELIDPGKDYVFGGSNYDLIKALSSQAKKVGHIREVLYLENSKKDYKLKINEKSLSSDYRPLVSIVIRSNDNLKRMSGLIGSILHISAYKDYEIIIVEDDEDDADEERAKLYRYYKLLSVHKNVRFLRIGKVGIGRAYNYAASHAKGDVLIFFDSFCEVGSVEWMEKLLTYLAEKSVGAVCARTSNPKGELVYAGSYYTDKRKSIVVYEDNKNKDFTRNVSVVGKFLIGARKETFFEIGGFDEGFDEDYYGEDFAIRCMDVGYENVYVSGARIITYQKNFAMNEDDRQLFARIHKEVVSYDRYREW